MEILNQGDLKEFVEELVSEIDGEDLRTLDEYLRALISLIYSYKDEKPSFSIFAELLKKSFTSEPSRYNSMWEQYKEPPFLNFGPNPDDYDNSLINPETNQTVSKFEVLEKTLMFQIADLRDIKKCMENGDTYLEEVDEDVDVEIKEGEEYKELEDRSWINFDVASYLDASLEALSDYSDTECDWLLLTDMLEYGRTYGGFEE